MTAPSRPIILLVTATRVETEAVLRVFCGGREPNAASIDGRVYFDLGVNNGVRVTLTRSEMGSAGLGSSQQTVEKGIASLSPIAVIMLGIAFGVDERKQHFGDVLVAERLRPYELQRVGTSSAGSVDVLLRDDKPHASPWLINLFKSAETTWHGASLQFGTILTGAKLVDNIDFRSQLLRLEREAIGGEMEGAGLYVASHDRKVDWIMAKAICDFADGQKHVDKSNRQEEAAKQAAAFVRHALSFASIDRDMRENNSTDPFTSLEITTRSPTVAEDDNSVVQALIKELEDSRPEVRSAAAYRLGESGAPKAVPALVAMLLSEPAYYKRAVGNALVGIGISALPDLLSTLGSVDEQTLKEMQYAVRAMGSEALPLVLSRLADPSAVVRLQSLVLCSDFDDSRAVPHLMTCLGDEDAKVRAYAALALGKMKKSGMDSIPLLIKALQDGASGVRSNAAKSIGELGPEHAIPFLVAALSDTDPLVRRSAVTSLGELHENGKNAVEPLMQSLKDEDERVREAAVQALGNVGRSATEAIPALKSALDDSYWGVHQNVPAALGQIGAEAIPTLIQALTHSDYHIRGGAAEALGTLGRAAVEAVPALVDCLNDRFTHVAEDAIDALGKIREPTPELNLELAKCILGHDEKLCHAAIRAAGRIGLHDTIDALVRATHNRAWWIRRSAVRAIGRLRAAKAKSRLLELLDDTEDEVRMCARQALLDIEKA